MMDELEKEIRQCMDELGLTPKEMLKEAVIQSVRDGNSFRKTSKLYSVPLNTVAYWCRRAEVLSPFLPPTKLVSDGAILKFVVDNGAVTMLMLEDHFRMSMQKRMHTMTKYYLKCYQPNMKHLFRYFGCHKFYALTDAGFASWFFSKVPKDKLPLAKSRVLEVVKI